MDLSVTPTDQRRKEFRVKKLLPRRTVREKQLFDFLRENGVGFKFQHIINPYVVDFYFKKKGLIVELDGGVHKRNFNIDHDNKRDKYFFSMGIITMRYDNKVPLGKILDEIKLFPRLDKKERKRVDDLMWKVNEIYSRRGIEVQSPDDIRCVFMAFKERYHKKRVSCWGITV